MAKKSHIVENNFNTCVPFTLEQMTFLKSIGSFSVSEELYKKRLEETARQREFEKANEGKPDDGLSDPSEEKPESETGKEE